MVCDKLYGGLPLSYRRLRGDLRRLGSGVLIAYQRPAVDAAQKRHLHQVQEARDAGQDERNSA